MNIIVAGILAFVVLLVLFIVFKTVLKAFFKLFLLVFFMVFIGSGFLVYLIYQDANDFKENFVVRDNLILLEDNSNILTGFVMNAGGQNVEILTKDIINEYNGYYNSNQKDKLLGNNYKIFIVDINSFSTTGSLQLNGQEISRNIAVDILKSSNPVETYLRNLPIPLEIGQAPLPEIEKADAELKASLFVLFVSEDLAKDPLNIALGIKKQSIEVYPETIMFKVMRYLPLSILESAGVFKEKLFKEELTG